MQEAKYFLVVRWLDGGHVADEANTALKAKFAQERAPFEKHMRIERFAGETEKSYGH